MKTYTHPPSLPHSTDYQLSINGQPVEVLATGVADFAIWVLEDCDFPCNVEVIVNREVVDVTLRPLAKSLTPVIEDRTVSFTLDRPEKISVDFGWGEKLLYLFAQHAETHPPDVRDASVVSFPSGQISEVPLLTLEAGQTLYLPGGAVLKGRIHVRGQAGIRICGHGIFDGSLSSLEGTGHVPSIILERCPGVHVEDITMVRPRGWMIMLAACVKATIRNVKQIGEVVCSDGIDIVGSRDVLIEDCFLHNNDDCVVIKAFHVGAKNLSGVNVDGRENVENVLVRRCTFSNWTSGNAMEIGHELSVDTIRGITFQDIDVLNVHGQGAVFSVHNNDRAMVSDVLFENIRIEHCYDKLIDFRTSISRFSTDDERGKVKGITLRNIHWNRTRYNAGYTVSLIGGWDEDHAIEDVTLENFNVDGRPILHLDELEICTRYCRNLRLIS